MKNVIRKVFNALGFDLRKISDPSTEYDAAFLEIYNQCKPFTMTSIERMYALYKSIEYVVKNNIPGDIYECGVWRGGSSMLAAKTLMKFGSTERNLFLFDTFEGMSEPTKDDMDASGTSAQHLLDTTKKDTSNNVWCLADITDVQRNMGSTGYPANKINYVKGKVEDTLPGFTVNDKISILRLDTDWYESTKTEMVYLYPSLQEKGVLIIDDYGYWQGAKKAIDEYINVNKLTILLNRIDDTGRIAIKTT